MKVTKLLELKSSIAKLINNSSASDFPKTIIFSRGIDFPQFKITIEVVEEDFFIDQKGVKWVRVNDK